MLRSKGGENVSEYSDCFSYRKEDNPTINICLNCTKEKCRGTCNKVRGDVGKEYVVKRSYTTLKNVTKTSYIAQVSVERGVTSTTNIFKARLRTYEGARLLMHRAKTHITDEKVHFEVVKRSDELEKIAKEKRKTGGHFVDANGNRLGQ